MRRRLLAVILWSAVLAWAGGILWLSAHTPGDLPGVAFFVPDKFSHFVAFALGGWLTGSALHLSRPEFPAGARTVLTIVLLALFGACDEGLQMFTPGRTGGDFYDWIADFLGAVAGALTTLLTHARLERLVSHP